MWPQNLDDDACLPFSLIEKILFWYDTRPSCKGVPKPR